VADLIPASLAGAVRRPVVWPVSMWWMLVALGGCWSVTTAVSATTSAARLRLMKREGGRLGTDHGVDRRAVYLQGDARDQCRVDAREAEGVLIGDQGTQINYFYTGTWFDEVAPSPLVSVSGAITSPYRGLSAFEERDAGLFFGRDAAAAGVLERMSRCLPGAGLLVVSGVSGAGKSSLLRAGVLPRLRGTGLPGAPEASSWPCVVLAPTSGPLAELAIRVAPLARADAGAVRQALAADPAGFALTAGQAALTTAPGLMAGDGRGQRRLVLVVDQFEQLFTQCELEEERQAFIIALHAAAAAGRGTGQLPAAVVVLVVRADFEARLADYPQLTAAVQDRYLLTSMTRRQLQLAITGPAAAAGSSVADDLVQVLLDEVGALAPGWLPGAPPGAAGAGVLPLLSHALDQAWRSRAGHVLTLADYERAGGIEGAVAGSAQRAYDRLAPAQQAAARQVFTRLTATTGDGVVTAARADRADLTAGTSGQQARDVETVLEAFAAERLLILAAGTVEISHEALLTAWPLLRDTWLADTRADRVVRTRLQATAREWVRAGRDPSYLYSGTRLEAAAGTATRIASDSRHAPLSQAETEFLGASRRAGRRRGRRRQSLTAILLALAVGLAIVAAAAVRASGQVSDQRDTAVLERDMVISGQLDSTSQALAATNATTSQLDAIAAWAIHPSAATRYAILAAAARPQIATLPAVQSVAFSRDGKMLAAVGENRRVRLLDAATRRPIGKPLAAAASTAVFSPDGKTLATINIYSEGGARLWDLATGQQIGRPFGNSDGSVGTVAFSPDGKTLATISGDDRVRLWDIATRRQIGASFNAGFASAITESLAFSPDGKTLVATSDAGGTVRRWDVATRRQIGASLHGDSGQSVAFSPDARTLATIPHGNGTVRLWDIATSRRIGRPFTASGDHTWAAAFSPDGTTLATGGLDGTVRLSDTTTRQQIGASFSAGSLVESVAFSPDGTTLATVNYNDTAQLWNVTTIRRTSRPLIDNQGDPVRSVALSPDGKTLATGDLHGTVRLWDMATRSQIGAPVTTEAGEAIDWAGFSPDGKILAVASSPNPVHANSTKGDVRLWDVATRRQIGNPLRTGMISSAAFSRNGKILAVAPAQIEETPHGSGVRLWDVATHRPVGQSLPWNGAQNSNWMAFSPNGGMLAADDHGTLRLWNATTSQQTGRAFTGDGSPLEPMAFSPNGKILVAADADGTMWLWNRATGQKVGTPIPTSTDPILAPVFSPDGETLAVPSSSDTPALWDVAARQEITVLRGAGDYLVNSLAFTPDGKTLVTADAGGAVRLWDVSYLKDPLAWLCSQIGGTLTRADWDQHVPLGPAYHNVCPS
jgi:WD40 repeat protein